MTAQEAPRVWVGCLGCYNNGELIGQWFDAADAPTDMDAWHSHPRVKGGTWVPEIRIPWRHYDDGGAPHEELWVFGHENFHGLLTGECSPATARALGEMIEAIEADGVDVAAVAAWASNVGVDLSSWDDVRGDFEDAFCGVFDSGADYARELANEVCSPGAFDKWPFTEIDWDHAWRELEIGGDNYALPTGEGTVYVFRGV